MSDRTDPKKIKELAEQPAAIRRRLDSKYGKLWRVRCRIAERQIWQ